MQRFIAGIDPGMDGAVALINPDGQYVKHWNMPTIEITMKTKNKNGEHRKRRAYGLRELLEIFRVLKTIGPVLVALERSQAMPNDGGVQAFAYGRGYGNLEMAMVAVGIPYTEIPPQTWKARILAGTARDKISAIRLAQQRHPEITIGKSDGLAEALLIAEYVRQTQGIAGLE